MNIPQIPKRKKDEIYPEYFSRIILSVLLYIIVWLVSGLWGFTKEQTVGLITDLRKSIVGKVVGYLVGSVFFFVLAISWHFDWQIVLIWNFIKGLVG